MMPLYRFTTEDDAVSVEELFEIGKCPKWIVLPSGEKAYRDYRYLRNRRSSSAGWPIYSTALGCLPKQAAALAKKLADAGVPTDIRVGKYSAKPELRDKRHRRKVCDVMGVVDYEGGYGDRT